MHLVPQVLASAGIGSGFITMVLVLRLYIGYSHVNSRCGGALQAGRQAG
jgi:hypothetical protein